MPRKKNPILGRAWDLIAWRSLGRKPTMIAARINLLIFKRKTKKFRLLTHYNHGFTGEYEFSPSSTPLFRCPRPPVSKKRRRFLSLFICGGHNAAESSAELEACSIAGDQSEPLNWAEEEEEEEEEGVSVDRRAERFIQRFYEEMRIQRRRSM